MYIWEPGRASERVVAALAARNPAAECRILVDAFGSSSFEEELREPLARTGCEVRVFRPLPGEEILARNHRKIVVTDGKTAITGGFGISDTWLGDGRSKDQWRDTNVRFTGPAVRAAQQAFAESWQESGGACCPRPTSHAGGGQGDARLALVTSTASPSSTRAERLVQLLIGAAHKRLWISTAYLAPSKGILALLANKGGAASTFG